MSVRAPFRMAPIARQVHFPKWGPLVSHDVPFRDGMSGEVEIELEATQPLLVGGVRREARSATDVPPNGREGEVWPFMAPDGSYAIPDSTIQGLARSNVEVAALGRLGDFVYNRRFGFRDLRSPTGTEFYQDRMATKARPSNIVTQHAQAGWLVKGNPHTRENPDVKIIHCKYARIQFGELRLLKGGSGADPLEQRNEVPVRYRWFLGGTVPTSALNRVVHLDPEIPHPHVGGTIHICYQLAFAAGQAGRVPTQGTVVLTGKPQNGVGQRAKKLEFVLHTPDRVGAAASTAFAPVAKDVWRDFTLIHEKQPGRPENPNWSYWKAEFEACRPVPVFYLTKGGVITTFGTAFMFKTALELSTHDMLKNSAPDHVAQPDDKRMDLPSLIFGAVADDSGRQGLKRRASFDLARVTSPPPSELHRVERAILLEPKPSFFPNYVDQPGNRATGQLDNQALPFATYAVGTGVTERTQPKLAGTKVYPARNSLSTAVRPPHLENQRSIQVTLNALPAGTRLRTTLRFHNLRPAELGAVFWALSFGCPEAWTPGSTIRLRHRMGMGKPYGLGEVAIRILAGTLAVERNDGGSQEASIADMVGAFEREMGGAVTNWRNLPQLRTLFAAADPAIEHAALQELEYMTLNPGTLDEFTKAKTDGWFLPGYMTPEAVFELREGARIRMNNLGPEGVITQIHGHRDPLRIECTVHLDGQTRKIRYNIQRFEVIG